MEIATALLIPQKAILVTRPAPFPPAGTRCVTSLTLEADELPPGLGPESYLLQLMMAMAHPGSALLRHSMAIVCQTPEGVSIGALNRTAKVAGGRGSSEKIQEGLMSWVSRMSAGVVGVDGVSPAAVSGFCCCFRQPEHWVLDPGR